MINKVIFIVTIILISLPFNSCNSRDDRLGNLKADKIKASSTKSENQKIGKVTYYLENSESMFGYVSGSTGYISVVSELAEKPEFVAEKTVRDFYFINGQSPVKTTSI